MTIDIGLAGRAELDVTDADTAIALGSGSVPVLGTPRVVALAEAACVDALDGQLAADQTSVGMKVQIDHLAPTAVGGHVDAEATLESIEGRRLTFTVRITDAKSLIAAGRIVRVVVSTETFLAKV